MPLGRPKVALILTDDERVRLESLAHRSRTAPHLARRARIILACAEGDDNTAVFPRPPSERDRIGCFAPESCVICPSIHQLQQQGLQPG